MLITPPQLLPSKAQTALQPSSRLCNLPGVGREAASPIMQMGKREINKRQRVAETGSKPRALIQPLHPWDLPSQGPAQCRKASLEGGHCQQDSSRGYVTRLRSTGMSFSPRHPQAEPRFPSVKAAHRTEFSPSDGTAGIVASH